MTIRAFGWVQNPSDFNKLKQTVEIFDSNSKQYQLLKNTLVREKLGNFKDIQSSLQDKLNKSIEEFSYIELVGRNISKDGKTPKTRKESLPNALIQISLDSQSATTKNKDFTDEWSSDGFLRWAVSLNFVEQDRQTDIFKITKKGKQFIEAQNEAEMNKVLREAFLSYPPATRVLEILKDNADVTKFFIGNRLGFKGEPGFTSYSEELMLDWIKESEDKKEESKIRSDVEGTADKYARMICGWLKKVGFVSQKSIQYESATNKERKITGFSLYSITAKGSHALKQSQGNSSNKKHDKFIMWEFLAVKGAGKDYIRTRRAYILKFLQTSTSFSSLMNHLKHKGFEESEEIIKLDIEGLNNIGIRIDFNGTTAKLLDKISDFTIPDINLNLATDEKERLELKEYFISNTNIPSKFITLLDLAYDGKANRDFEIVTAELFEDVFKLKAKHMGGTRKPDILIWTDKFGIIADTKAYSKGYKKNISEADKMVRYVNENNIRNKKDNGNEWWNSFDSNIPEDKYFYLWISSEFVGKFDEQLTETASRTGRDGAAINVYQLLRGADLAQKSQFDVHDFPSLMKNNEIKFV
ncbi:restriction endonuclease [Macrococcoides caseolyticum]|uniref:restriction endonuclease FokI C-terminal domain-containing protein n=1 Tax=Macrococcoides caseolyticum TaxID=69966 RepID=UPI000C330643|nr:restriction endonuclease FokI C-terminal domain-containing protein [Macrococcus caseolyticus]PKE69225.1 restriction endonuclease [Macrococcus caseolyticus]